MDDDARPGLYRTYADSIDHLFNHRLPEGRTRPYSNREVAAAIGPGVSHTTLSTLRSGSVVNPQVETLQAIANFFKVPIAYFFDEEVARRIDNPGESAGVHDLREATATPERLAVMARGMSSVGLSQILEIMDYVKTLEQQNKQSNGES